MRDDRSIVRKLPPLPGSLDGRNTERASWAESAVDTFQAATGTDDCDALADLLGDLMHLCDRRQSIEAFDDALERARGMYAQEAPPVGSESDGGECDKESRDNDVKGA